jgi:hypothetical protein
MGSLAASATTAVPGCGASAAALTRANAASHPDHLVSGCCEDAPEAAFAAAHIDGQAAGRRQQVEEMGQVKLPEVIVQVR